MATPRTWVVGETVTAALMNLELRDPLTPNATTTGLIVASGFTLNSFDAVIVAGMCTVTVYVATTTPIPTTSSTTSNIIDKQMATLPGGYRPRFIVSAIFSTGTMSGEATVDTAGVIMLRTSDYNQPVDGNVRMSAAFAAAA